MAQKEMTIYQAACQRLRISRNGAVTQLVMDGQGSAVCLTAEFVPAQKWAQSKTSMMNGLQCAQKLIEKIEIIVARPGTTFAGTRGSAKPLGDLLRAMKSAGFDVTEWGFPPDVLEPEPEIGTQEWKEWMAKKKADKEAKEAKNKEALAREALAKNFGEQGNP